jgi:hypothetical protein
MYPSSNPLQYFEDGASSYQTNLPVSTGQWQHIVINYDSVNKSLNYYNEGVLKQINGISNMLGFSIGDKFTFVNFFFLTNK